MPSHPDGFEGIGGERNGWRASNVRLQVEALDVSGNVGGPNLGFVFGDVPPANRSYFEIPVSGGGVASYRVTVRTLADMRAGLDRLGRHPHRNGTRDHPSS